MATAKAGPRKTTRTVTLKLTEGEADLLLALAGSAGGHLSKSPRKYAKRIVTALQDALGYRVIDTDAYRLSLGNVEFFEYDNHPKIRPSQRALSAMRSAGVQLRAEFYPDQSELPWLLELIARVHEENERSEVSR